ncbi:MAG: ABC transporter substrate-binding protein [Corynebacterium sp.]|uniref:ABC transporter substrate-binding protein n=1 Tax=unclassified Corynebacterium TaxID=2624378 RepID=UPI002647C44F|nr:ABC transporter substrate-binding protein [Corynebacterium sp.]MDN5581637.1 ABC transporter substrate-binding protein [Corynebacterium sp.]MDN5718794.1 ABC transporter substrate-binding protein [Corynebacterium sp.]
MGTAGTRGMSVLVACACVVGLAACSSSSDDESSTSTEASAENSNSTETVEHAYGSTEVPVNPERAISFSQAWSDSFAALGHPVSTQVISSVFTDDTVPWNTEASGAAAETITNTGGGGNAIESFGLEEIAATDPDVILAGYVPDQATYDALSEIAPTVATVGTGKVDDWREVTTAAGRVLDEQDRAEEVVADVDERMAQVTEEYPAVDGASFAYAAYTDGSFSVLSSEDDAANKFFTDLGMDLTADEIEGEANARGIEVSAENISLLDMDLLAVWVRGTTPDDLPDGLSGWSSLPSVEAGTAAELQSAAATALGAPTALAIPWLLDELDTYFSNL